MAQQPNTQLEDQEKIESLRVFERADSSNDSQGSEIKTKLLHHLVEFSRVFQKKLSEREIVELIKKNNSLVNELLDWKIKPAAAEGSKAIVSASNAWKEYLLQKLIDNKVDLADPKLKTFVDKVEFTSTKIEKLISAVVQGVTSSAEPEKKVTFEIESKLVGENLSVPSWKDHVEELSMCGLVFEVQVYQNPFELEVNLIKSLLEPSVSYKVKIKTIIKNHAGQPNWTRSFIKQFNLSESLAKRFNCLKFIQMDECEDASLGLVKDGKMQLEVVISIEGFEFQ